MPEKFKNEKNVKKQLHVQEQLLLAQKCIRKFLDAHFLWVQNNSFSAKIF
jgi:hypothetical protein